MARIDVESKGSETNQPDPYQGLNQNVLGKHSNGNVPEAWGNPPKNKSYDNDLFNKEIQLIKPGV